MSIGLAQCVNKGMQRDYSMDKASQEFAYENRNIRITTTGNESFLSITNEKSTKEITLLFDDGSAEFVDGFVILGSTTINDYLILFGTSGITNLDYIYKINIESDYNEGYITTLYQGNLGFSTNNPIECIASYEGDEVLKVYWVDGLNQPRYINVFPDTTYPENTSFDFVPSIVEGIDVSIEKNYDGTGNFKSGVIQYFITYYKKFGAETNAAYQSSLYYISPEDRGGKVNEDQTCSFNIKITPKTNKFDYVRVYSIVRTSLNSTPQVSIVGEASIIEKEKGSSVFNEISIIDTNTHNIPVAPTDIMFLGGNTIIASTIEQKDNTLFLGDIKNSVPISEGIKAFKEVIDTRRNLTPYGKEIEGGYKSEDETKLSHLFSFKYKALNYFDSEQQYNYQQYFNYPLNWTKYFKLGEVYRIGVQFQSSTGEWSSTIWLQDVSNTEKPPVIRDEEVKEDESTDILLLKKDGDAALLLPYLRVNFYASGEMQHLLENIKKEGYTNYRLVMAEPSYSDRKILSQGYVSPTIFRLGQRITKTCNSQASWFARPIIGNKYKHLDNINHVLESDSGVLYPGFDSELEAPLAGNYIEIAASTVESPNLDNTSYILREIGYKVYVRRYATPFWSNAHKYHISIRFGISKVVDGVEGEIIYTDYLKVIWDDYVTTLKNVYNQSLNQFVSLKYNNTIFNHIKETIPALASLSDLNVNVGDLVFKGTPEYIYWDSKEYPSLSMSRLKKGDYDNWGASGAEWVEKTYSKAVQRFGAGYTIVEEAKDDYSENFFLDATTVGFYAPNLEKIHTSLDNVKFRIVGKTDIVKNTSDYIIKSVDGTDVKGLITNKIANYNFNNNFTEDGSIRGLKSFPLLHDGQANRLYNVNVWNRSGAMIGEIVKSNNEIISATSELSNKIYANLWFGSPTVYRFNVQKEDGSYLNGPIKWTHPYGISDIKYTGTNDSIVFDDLDVYNNNVEDALFYNTFTSYFKDISAYALKQTLKESDLQYIKQDNKNVNIKYSSSNHVVFKLPDISGQMCPLPGYVNPRLENNSYMQMLWDDTIYPKFTPSEYFYFSLGSEYVMVNGVTSLYNKGRYYIEEGTNNIVFDRTNSDWSGFGVFNVGDVKFVEAVVYNGYTITERLQFLGVVKQVSNLDSTGRYQKIVFENINANNNATFNGFFQYKASLYENGYFSPAFVLSKNILVQSPFSYLSGSDIDDTIQDAQGNYLPLFKFGKHINTQSNPDNQWINSIDKLRTWLPHNPKGNLKVGDTYSLIEGDTSLENSLWIGELFRDLEDFTPYGGTSENAVELNTFIPISEATPIGEAIEGLEGDTYFQRWDSVRIYPTNDTDEQSVVDVVSVMLETHENLDGRSDITRGRTDITNMRPENTMETINDVYSQSNNYITSTVLDTKYNDFTHPTLYAWSLSKQAMSDIDTWTSINLVSSSKLDGDKGALTKIKRWNNYLLAFQEKGLAVINFNQQTTISTGEGVPVEIANSGKVTGHYYLSSTQGCKNKWSIVDSPYGIYFVDSFNKSINIFGSEGIKSLSTLNLFQDWIVENEKGIIWNPLNNGGFKSFYDPIHKEAYFINDKEALCYNELLGQFTSFYDYGSLNTMVPLSGSIFGIKDASIHKMFEGDDYCKLFDNQKNYSITYKINKDPFIDKVWTNIEYRADVFNTGNISNMNAYKVDNETFNTLKVWNEYQNGTADLMGSKYPNAKNKFRIWRADIPRDSNDTRKINRIRNPWIMLKLEKTTNTDKRMEFHDLIIKYLQ